MIYSPLILQQLGIPPDAPMARGLREYEEADSLVLAETGADQREFFLIPAAASAWTQMKAAATKGGESIFLVSAYRSVKRQVEIIQEKLDAGRKIDEILTVVAPPGYSEHHTGRAIDIASPDCPDLDLEFENTSAFRWLNEHAERFGFRLSYPRGNADGYQYEPWHWCFQNAVAPRAES